VPSKTVASGSITLDNAADQACVGLAYTSKYISLRLEGGSADGTAQGKPKSIHQATIRVRNTLGLNVGTVDGNEDVIEVRTALDPLNNAPPLVTADIEVEPPENTDTEGRLIITQTQPLPQTIIGYALEFNTNDG